MMIKPRDNYREKMDFVVGRRRGSAAEEITHAGRRGRTIHGEPAATKTLFL